MFVSWRGLYIYIYVKQLFKQRHFSIRQSSRETYPWFQKNLSESKDDKNKPLVPVEPVDTDHNLKVQGPGGNRNLGSEMFHGF